MKTKPIPCCPSTVTLPGCASEAEGRRYVTRNYRTWPVCPLHGAELTVTRYGSDPAKLGCSKKATAVPEMSASITCSQCLGGGCYTCAGSGSINVAPGHQSFPWTVTSIPNTFVQPASGPARCTPCGGTGDLNWLGGVCPTCSGTGLATP